MSVSQTSPGVLGRPGRGSVRLRRFALVDGAGPLVALGPLEERVDGEDGVVDAGVEVAELERSARAPSCMVQSSGSTSSTSSHLIGVDTVASGIPRTE